MIQMSTLCFKKKTKLTQTLAIYFSEFGSFRSALRESG